MQNYFYIYRQTKIMPMKANGFQNMNLQWFGKKANDRKTF